MRIFLDMLRGLACFLVIIPMMIGIIWLIMPSQDQGRTMLGLAGGGTLLFVIVAVALSLVTMKPA